jgi:hypothetical protein
MEAVRSSETLVSYITTRCHKREELDLNIHQKFSTRLGGFVDIVICNYNKQALFEQSV